MKELRQIQPPPILETHYPIRRTPMKRWIIAESRKNYQSQTVNNSCTEAAYHRVIDLVKKHLKQGEVYFERDYKTDRADGATSMHSFITSTFYWRLDCTFLYDYVVEFAFCNCAFEAEIRAMLIPYPLDRQASQRELQPDFTTFYKRVLSIQSAEFIHSFIR